MNYYPYTTTLLNVPRSQFGDLLKGDSNDWAALVTAKLLRLPDVADQSLEQLATLLDTDALPQEATISADVLAALAEELRSGAISAQEMAQKMQALSAAAAKKTAPVSVQDLVKEIESSSGLAHEVYEAARYDLLESVIVTENASSTKDLSQHADATECRRHADRMGISDICLLNDFPVISASYGYSRVDYGPADSILNPFPMDRRSGKSPVFVDKVEADAIRVSIDHLRIMRWLAANGVDVPARNLDPDGEVARRAYFIRVFDGIPLRATLTGDVRETRLCFVLLHTLSHIFIRRAAFLAGLESTSVSEYLLPRSMENLLYCSHRRGATIGALTALFELSVLDWLSSVRDSRRCVYDPVCAARGASCHACTHLAETSCRFFNLNLSRSVLFGGTDPVVGGIAVGFLDPALFTEPISFAVRRPVPSCKQRVTETHTNRTGDAPHG